MLVVGSIIGVQVGGAVKNVIRMSKRLGCSAATIFKYRSKPNNTDEPRRVLYITYNKISDGDHRSKYFSDKRLYYPQDCERDPNKKYEFLV